MPRPCDAPRTLGRQPCLGLSTNRMPLPHSREPALCTRMHAEAGLQSELRACHCRSRPQPQCGSRTDILIDLQVPANQPTPMEAKQLCSACPRTGVRLHRRLCVLVRSPRPCLPSSSGAGSLGIARVHSCLLPALPAVALRARLPLAQLRPAAIGTGDRRCKRVGSGGRLV